MAKQLTPSNLSPNGIVFNADAGFDGAAIKTFCEMKGIIANIDKNPRNGIAEKVTSLFDETLYKCQFVIERTNAWLDAFKTLIVRFETNDLHWRAWHFIAFIVI